MTISFFLLFSSLLKNIYEIIFETWIVTLNCNRQSSISLRDSRQFSFLNWKSSCLVRVVKEEKSFILLACLFINNIFYIDDDDHWQSITRVIHETVKSIIRFYISLAYIPCVYIVVCYCRLSIVVFQIPHLHPLIHNHSIVSIFYFEMAVLCAHCYRWMRYKSFIKYHFSCSSKKRCVASREFTLLLFYTHFQFWIEFFDVFYVAWTYKFSPRQQ